MKLLRTRNLLMFWSVWFLWTRDSSNIVTCLRFDLGAFGIACGGTNRNADLLWHQGTKQVHLIVA